MTLRSLSTQLWVYAAIINLTYICVVETGDSDNPPPMKEMNISTILDSLQQGYDKRIRPNYGEHHVDVGITMHLLSISSLSEVQMDFTVDFYFRQHWTDSRLAFPNQQGLNELTVGTEYLQNLWVPDTFFANEKKSYFHEATTSNEMLRITSKGRVLRSIRLTITADCPMDLQYFPMDRQLCVIEIESFAYSTNHIRLSWHAGDKSVVIDPDVSLPQFRVLGFSRKTIVATTSTGNYSRLLCEIMFVRSMGYYLIQIYIPSSLIVVISWVSFWLNRSATPARVSLGVTTVLTMTTLMSSTNAALPKISYVKSIDVFLGTCFVMVFASLLEYAAVGYMGKRIQMRKNRILTLQKLAEQRKAATALEVSHASGDHSDHASKRGKVSSRGFVTSYDSPPPSMRRPGRLDGMPQHCRNRPQIDMSHTYKIPERTPKQARHLSTPSFQKKDMHKLNKLYGCSPSDIDKYSRIVFPVCFVCFNLMYWIIYLHISDAPVDELTLHVTDN